MVWRLATAPFLSKRKMPSKFHLTSPGNELFAIDQTGCAFGPLTSTFASRWQPGLFVGTPLDSQKPPTCVSGSSWAPNSSEGKMRISSDGPKCLYSSWRSL